MLQCVDKEITILYSWIMKQGGLWEMKRKQIKNITLIILFMLLIQIISNILIPVESIAADEIVTIQCNDINFYNRLIEHLGDKIQSKDDTMKTITMTKTNVESVTIINIGNNTQKDEKK